MFLANGWKDFEIINAGNGEKLERWGDIVLLRPDPQAIWPMKAPDHIDAHYIRSSSGGGEWQFTINKDYVLDEELFVRMAQCSALFPMIQFSTAPWRVLGDEAQALCLDAARLHAGFGDCIVALVKDAQLSGEPIIRSMEYSYPHMGYETVYDQFLLGDGILVAPVLTKGDVTRRVILPEGKWRYRDGTVYDGGATVTVDAPLSVLPYFERLK